MSVAWLLFIQLKRLLATGSEEIYSYLDVRENRSLLLRCTTPSRNRIKYDLRLLLLGIIHSRVFVIVSRLWFSLLEETILNVVHTTCTMPTHCHVQFSFYFCLEVILPLNVEQTTSITNLSKFLLFFFISELLVSA